MMKLGVLIIMLTFIAHVAAAVPATRPTTQEALATVEKDGLQVTVFADKTVFAKNEPIKFTVRFKNISDKQVSLQYADEFQDWIVRLEEVTSKMLWRLQGLSDEPRPARQTRILMPGEVVEVTTEWGSNRFPFRYESELILNMPIPPADSLRPGRYRLWLGINLKMISERGGAHMAFRGDINLGPVEIEISDKDDPTGIQTSEAVKESNVEFQTVTRPKWSIPAAGAKSDVQIGLKVTNHTGTWMQINVFDTLQMILEDSQGMQLRCVRSRYHTLIPEPPTLEPRESRTVYRNATLEWSEDGKSLRLSGSDGAGGNWRFDDLKPGKYTVHFLYENDDERMKSIVNRPVKHAIDPKEAPFWMGKVTSKDAAVELVEGPAKPEARADVNALIAGQIAHLADADKGECAAAVKRLAKIGAPAGPALLKALGDSRNDVRAYAADALRPILAADPTSAPNCHEQSYWEHQIAQVTRGMKSDDAIRLLLPQASPEE